MSPGQYVILGQHVLAPHDGHRKTDELWVNWCN